jgi:hypothetical protein
MVRKIKFSVFIASLMFLVACTFPHPPLPYNPSNPLKRVAVLPLRNDTNDVDGPDVMRKKMVKALENHSYVVKDLKETDQILRDRMGITLGGQLALTTAQKLGEELEVEGVLYGTLLDFDESTLGAVSVKKVRGKFKLVNTATGQVMWERGLGVRSEMMMQGAGGAAATIASRLSDANDKEAPWVTIQSTTTGSDNVGKSFAIELGAKLITKAVGRHLDYESEQLAMRVTRNLPWGPGPGVVVAHAAPVSSPVIARHEMKTPGPPSFGYMDWEGKRDFSAVVFSQSLNKTQNDTVDMEMPIAIAGVKMRMDMDMSKMAKGGDRQSPMSKMSMIARGDKKLSYMLYPNTQKYIVNTETEEQGEKPQVEKTKLGSEMVGKYMTDKYHVKVTYKDGKVDEGLIWNARELGGLTIKSEVENKDFRVTTELKNIVLKTPAASLFEIPEGYTEAKSFMDVMTTDEKK